MKKFMKVAAMAMVGLFMFLPMVNVHAEEGVAVVKSEEDLKVALADESINTIQLDADITTTEKVNILRDVTIDGGNHKITLDGDHTTWDSTYVLHVYEVNVTLKDIALTGANGGLLVNGGNVTIEGTLDVSGNHFGGIELGKGQAVETLPVINFNNATVVNTTESDAQPTLWSDGIAQEEVTVKYNGVEAAIYNTDKDQVQLFLNEENTPTGDNVTVLDVTEYQPEPVEEPTEPTEPTDPVEDETQDRVEDATENPETSDGILLFASLAVIGLAGTALAYRRLHN